MRFVVLDDDPTGIQTVHGCLALTQWDTSTLHTAFNDEVPFFYILTNTRAYGPDRVRRIITECVRNVLAVNREYDDKLMFISRSDSTLRGHFPLEIFLIADAVENERMEPVDIIFLVPAFFEGGRITKDDTHYLRDGDRLVPTADTEFARDAVFGYRSSHLPTYIEEKTNGETRAQDVVSLSLADIRGPQHKSLDKLLPLQYRTFVAVNAETYADLDRFSDIVRQLIQQGKSVIFQSAASLVKSLTNTPNRPLLGPEIVTKIDSGIVLVGSHVQKTSNQLQHLLKAPAIQSIEVDVQTILESGEKLLPNVLQQVLAAVHDGKTPIVFTSRHELRYASLQERLQAGQRISQFLVRIVQQLPFDPAYIIAKGGITSHDILARGLHVATVRVLGQILPGVPVIALPRSHRFGGIPYIIFPGNVGSDEALTHVYRTLAPAITWPV